MYIKHQIKKSIILGIISLSLLLASFSSIGHPSPGPYQDDVDGFWIDEFDDEEGIWIEASRNCELSDGKVVLAKKGEHKSYDFKPDTRQHEAYSYQTAFFLSFPPPALRCLLFETPFDEIGLDIIGSDNREDKNRYYPHTDVKNSSVKIVHHFRFKIDSDFEIKTVAIRWDGKAENDEKVTLFYWKPGYSIFGQWIPLDDDISYGRDIKLKGIVREYDLPIVYNNYIDICVVVSPRPFEKCRLFTDYVKIITWGRDYYFSGHIFSDLIEPEKIFSWEMFTWKHHVIPGVTTIKYHVCHENGGLIDDSILKGNSRGFDKPVPIYSISFKAPNITKIRLKASFATKDTSVSPELYSWGVTWQTENNTWQDHFNSDLRIDKDTLYNVDVKEGYVRISPSVNDWPMFGQDSGNTRSSEGFGPDTKNLHWWSLDRTGGGYKNPVIRAGVLYIASLNGTRICAFDAIRTEKGIRENNPFQYVEIPDGLIVTNTPAVTNKYVIVATGSVAEGGCKNKVFAFDIDTFIKKHEYSYRDVSEDSNICYYASPTVADGRVYLSSWSGDSLVWNPLYSIWDFLNLTRGNNKLIVLDSETLTEIWTKDLPAGSFSSPAVDVKKDVVVVGCQNLNISIGREGSSLFAFSLNGQLRWSKDIGPIGRASPVIYEDKVFVVVKKPLVPLTKTLADSKLVALWLENGTEIWNVTISKASPYHLAGCSTPAVHDGILYVTSPDNQVYAFDVNNGKKKWDPRKLTMVPTFDPVSSPCYADGKIYVGSPNGLFYAFSATNGKEIWRYHNKDPIFSSPIVVDGLVYYSDEKGCLLSLGVPRMPGFTGRLISTPIKLPSSNYAWHKFKASFEKGKGGEVSFKILDILYKPIMENIVSGTMLSGVDKNTIRLCVEFSATNASSIARLKHWSVTIKPVSKGPVFQEHTYEATREPPIICSIKVSDNHTGLLVTSAKYIVKYRDQQGFLNDTGWRSAECTGKNGSRRMETISANISQLNLSEDFSKVQIKFSIKNILGNESESQWHYVFEPEDTLKPVFYPETFKPEYGIAGDTTPFCSLEVQDEGMDIISGLNVSSAGFILKYRDHTGEKSYNGTAECTGFNGSKRRETIKVDVSKLEFSENITDLIEITFYIKDMTGNRNEFTHDLIVDKEKPSSHVTYVEDYRCNFTPVLVEAQATDNTKKIKTVALYYRPPGGEWLFFKEDNTPPYNWSFFLETSGEYELCSVATDFAGNVEDKPKEGDVSFIYDPYPPFPPKLPEGIWFNTRPLVTIEFSDGYLLYMIEFRTDDEWTLLERDINKPVYNLTWELPQDEWDQMEDGETYLLYFKVTDSLGNIYISSDDEALTIKKDTEKPSMDLKIPEPEEGWKWGDTINISATADDEESGIEKMLVYCRGSRERNWTEYELTSPPYKLEFEAEEGNEYYEFYVKVWDKAGNVAQSEIYQIDIVPAFPLIQVITLVSFLIALVIIGILLFIKWKKK